MTQDQSRALAGLRADLDCIDDQILALLERRLAASAAIAAAKSAEEGRHLKLRPRRQRQILERLKGKARIAAPELIDRVWREIMAHGLQAQGTTELVLAPCDEPELLAALVRAHFGSAAPIRLAASAVEAIRAAEEEEAVAILPLPIAERPGGLHAFDVIARSDGRPVAHAVGRMHRDEVEAEPWSPESWRSHPAQQLPHYPDPAAVAVVEQRLEKAPPLVEVADIRALRASLARVAEGDGFLLQGGDCAESFAEFSADKVRSTWTLLLQMGAMLRTRGDIDVVHLARIAGQFAKPRSAITETIGDVTLPSYRGDAVNGAEFTAGTRTPDPKRLLDAYDQAHETVDLIARYQAEASSRRVFTSHEALLLNYEQALTRFDEETGQHWATSGHMLWIGDRTRQLDGAHVEFARGVGNPIGLKCGPSLSPDDMLRLIDRLDPENVPGRLVLIGRFGAANIGNHLAPLMRATEAEGRKAIWSIDPMHGNTRAIGGVKTRIVGDVLAEIGSFFDIAAAEGVHPGGVHLEMTGSDVTECIGGTLKLAREDLGRSYLTHCDPRLNASQAMDVAHATADHLADFARRAAAA